MCGIIGIICGDENSHVNQALVDALTVLQHRGQDAAGIVTSHNNRLNLRKDTGLVSEVFTQENIINLRGNMGIGHVRYPTAGGSNSAEAQPFYCSYPFGIALGHNGNLTNTAELLSSVQKSHRHVNTDSDSEVLLNIFADELSRRNLNDITPDDIFDSVQIVMRKCKGGYAVVVLVNGLGLLAFRDPLGIRPLCYGSRKAETAVDFAISSESVGIDILYPSFTFERDLHPGEAIFISAHTKQPYTHICCPGPRRLTPCLFEYVYFARPDSRLDGVQVYGARYRMGEMLARKVVEVCGEQHGIDVVIPIPETSRTAALSCASLLSVPYREGFVKNRYIARTFIMPGQAMRQKTLKLKLNAICSEFQGKSVLLVDDSIVRGTTSMELVRMARDAGAKKVIFASAAPPVRYPNVYGIDIPTRAELVAHNRSVDEISQVIGADQVIYNDLADVLEAVRSLNPDILQMEDSCFSGVYVTEEVTEQYLETLESFRGKSSTEVGVESGDAGGDINSSIFGEIAGSSVSSGQRSSMNMDSQTFHENKSSK